VDVPKDRDIYIHGDGEHNDHFAVELAKAIMSLSHPSVRIVNGGPEEIVASGFLYHKDPVAWSKLLEEKKLAAEAHKSKK